MVEEKILGILQIEKRLAGEGILRMIAIKNEYQKKGYGSILMHFAHAMLRKMGVYTVHLHARIEQEAFYKAWGYREKHFEDPDALPDDEKIDMGSLLG